MDRVTHLASFPFDVRGSDAVVGTGTGNWDQLATPLEEGRLYRSLTQRFEGGVDWEDTPIYQWAERRIAGGDHAWNGCRSSADLKERCDMLEDLHADMANTGYRSQVEAEWTKPLRGSTVPDELRVVVARDGHFIRCACGYHRLCLARIVGLETVPALVQIEHAD